MGHDSNRKFYERPDGYVYTEQELEAYKISFRNRDPCVNFFVPYKLCIDKQSFVTNMLDHSKGKCSEEHNAFKACQTQYLTYEGNTHIKNAFWNDKKLAEKLGVSGTYAPNHYRSPIAQELL